MSDLMAELGFTTTVDGREVVEAIRQANQEATITQFPVMRSADPQWERCKPWIEAGLEGSLLKIADIEAMVRDGRMVLWPGRECAIVTEVMTYTGGDKAMQCVSAGGKLEEIASMIGGIEAAARREGCSVTLIEGRAGWSKLLKANGYAQHSVTMRKALT